jgi:murein DD-endopeptidase / murein LD-carboxypeptidase
MFLIKILFLFALGCSPIYAQEISESLNYDVLPFSDDEDVADIDDDLLVFGNTEYMSDVFDIEEDLSDEAIWDVPFFEWKQDPILKLSFSSVDELLAYGRKFLGVPYRSGGKGPGGFDCSGFVSYVFSNFGEKLPSSSAAMSLIGNRVGINDAKPGDLIYFKGRSLHSRRVGHIGIVTENNDGNIRFIHASLNKGITFDEISLDYYRKRFLGIRRVLSDD